MEKNPNSGRMNSNYNVFISLEQINLIVATNYIWKQIN